MSKIINKDDQRRLVGNFFSLIVLRGFQFLIPLFTLPYLVRTIGLVNFGLVNFALSLAIYFGAVIQFGFGITATREIARNRGDKINLNQIYSVTLTASLLLAVFSIITFGLIVIIFDKFNQYFYLYLFTIMFVVFQSLFPIWFFQGMEKMKYITFLSLGTKIMFLISLFTFVKQADDFVLVPLLNAISALVTYVIAIILIRNQFKVVFIFPKIKELKIIYKSSFNAFLTQFIPNIYTNTVTFLLGIFASNSAVGLFTAATKIIDALGSVVYVFSNTFLPFLSRNINKHKFFQKLMFIVGLSISLLLFFLADYIVSFMYGDIDNIVVFYIKALSLGIPLIFIQITFGQNYLMLVGLEKTYKNIVFSFSFLSLSFSLPLIYLYGAWGSIFTLIFTRVLISIFTLKAYKQHEEK